MESDKDSQTTIAVEGIFEPQNNKAGVLLNTKYNGKSRPTDPFVPRELVRRFKLKRGNYVTGNGQADAVVSAGNTGALPTLPIFQPLTQPKQELKQFLSLYPPS